MSLKSELKHFFTPKKWKTIFRGDGSAERLRFGIPINRFNVAVILKVSTNKRKNSYKCYYTNGDMKQNLNIDMLIYDFPEVKPILDEYNIEY